MYEEFALTIEKDFAYKNDSLVSFEISRWLLKFDLLI